MQDKDKEKIFFDHFAGSRDYDVFTPGGYGAIIAEYLRFMAVEDPAKLRILDLGCGTGAFARHFKARCGARFWGLDISPASVSLAAQLAPDISFCVGDMEACCFGDDSFDVVSFSGVLHHFTDYRKCLAEALRILKPGGRVLSYDPHLKNPAMWLYRHPDSPFFSNRGKTDNERLLTGDELAGSLREAGFAGVRVGAIGGVTFKYVESPLGRAVLPVYNLWERAFGLVTPLARKYGSFLIARGEKP